MNVHSAAHSGSSLLSATAYYRPQQKTRATPNRAASYITNLRDKWADLSLSLCVGWNFFVLEKGLNLIGSTAVSQSGRSHLVMTPLLLSLPLWKCFAMTRVLPHVKDAVTICTLGIGTAFGESILDNTPRHATIVTREFSELLRIEQREFRTLWEVCQSTDNTPIMT